MCQRTPLVPRLRLEESESKKNEDRRIDGDQRPWAVGKGIVGHACGFRGKSATDSDLKSATDSDLKPATRSEASRPLIPI